MLHLLDADAVIDALKALRATLDLLEALVQRCDSLATNAIVLCEVYAGLHHQEEPAAIQFLSKLAYLPISASAARQAGRWRYDYARRGTALSHTDCLIAACAQEHQAILITGNVKDFPMAATGGITLLALPRPQRRS